MGHGRTACLRGRLRGALDRTRRLDTRRELQGTLDPEDEALFRRCDKLAKRLKGVEGRSRIEAEGHDDFERRDDLNSERLPVQTPLDTSPSSTTRPGMPAKSRAFRLIRVALRNAAVTPMATSAARRRGEPS